MIYKWGERAAASGQRVYAPVEIVRGGGGRPRPQSEEADVGGVKDEEGSQCCQLSAYGGGVFRVGVGLVEDAPGRGASEGTQKPAAAGLTRTGRPRRSLSLTRSPMHLGASQIRPTRQPTHAPARETRTAPPRHPASMTAADVGAATSSPARRASASPPTPPPAASRLCVGERRMGESESGLASVRMTGGAKPPIRIIHRSIENTRQKPEAFRSGFHAGLKDFDWKKTRRSTGRSVGARACARPDPDLDDRRSAFMPMWTAADGPASCVLNLSSKKLVGQAIRRASEFELSAPNGHLSTFANRAQMNCFGMGIFTPPSEMVDRGRSTICVPKAPEVPVVPKAKKPVVGPFGRSKRVSRGST